MPIKKKTCTTVKSCFMSHAEKYVFIVLILNPGFTGCGSNDSDGYNAVSRSNDISASSNPSAIAVPTSDNVELTYSLTIGSAAKNIYLVFSNPYASSSSDITSFSASMQHPVPETVKSISSLSSRPVIRKDHPALINAKAAELIPADERISAGISRNTIGSASGDKEGISKKNFYAISNDHYSLVPSMCRYSNTFMPGNGSKTLNIWVADNCWTESDESNKISQTMVEVLAGKFISNKPSSGEPADIYSLVSGIFGEEWGPTRYSNLINYNDEITILLLDIDEDSKTTGTLTLGYFNPDDCYTASSVSTSNERMMFYIDAVLFAKPDSTEWDIYDYWPSEMISTLAHEFQHMIHFYQKRVLRSGESQTWLNEMCSMMAEDLVAEKISVNGPRGVSCSDYTAGSAGNTTGRFSDFIGNTKLPLFKWSGNVDSYGESYAFGAFIGRNFGGASLFRSIVQSRYTSSDAVTCALDQNGYSSESFNTVFSKWGAAMLISDSKSAPAGYKYNASGFFSSKLDSVTFNLGSINAYNYTDGSQTGPRTYSSLSEPLSSGETILYSAGSLTGTHSWTIHLPSSVKLTVVAK